MQDGESRDSRRALREANWEEVLPQLVAYGQWLVNRGRNIATIAVDDLINEAVQRVLDGRRTWRSDEPLVQFLRGAMKSIAHQMFKARRYDRELTDDDELQADVFENFSDGETDSRLVDLDAAIEGDDELTDYCCAVMDLESPKREHIATHLGWPAERVSVASKKLKRRLLASKRETK